MQQERFAHMAQQEYIVARPENLVAARNALIADLKQRYGGIDVSVTERQAAIQHLGRFQQLMREWNPLGCSVQDLKSIAGKPSNESEKPTEGGGASQKTLTYYFYGDGLGGGGWEFTIRGDEIVAVRLIKGR